MTANVPPKTDRREYDLRPLLIDAALAHTEGIVTYSEDGTATVRSPRLTSTDWPGEFVIPPGRQFPCIRATFDDLNKALSRLANSPLLDGGGSLRAAYEEELDRYESLAAAAYAAGQFEPDYGTYVFDHRAGDLYLIAPERWHRLALVTSNARLLADPERKLSWRELRERLEGAVLGFAGLSVGGNLLEGWLREVRPRAVKIADPDWIEVTNLNRGERMSLRHVVGSRAQRFDIKNPYEVPRVSKAEYAAYEANLVDPYLDVWTYKEGLTRTNLDRFFDGDGADEPAIDIFVEEMDHVDLKILSRQTARAKGIDVLMLSDFGHSVHMLWNQFREQPGSALGYGASDEELLAAGEACKRGERARFFEFVDALCGKGWADQSFLELIDGRGEQPTASTPQTGATVMASGAIGGKELALHVLGHHRGQPSPCRVVYDLCNRTMVREQP